MPIHRLRPDHVISYRTLMLEAYVLHPEAFTSSEAERAVLPLDWWRSRLKSDAVFGALDKDQLLGVAGLSFESREKVRHKATLFGMYVPQRFGRQGIGFRLIQAVLEHARHHKGIRLVQLTVTDGNHTAQRLYERCGFEVFGVEPMAVSIGKAFVNKLHLWQEIHPAK
nr:GNAT family N-acetyltransferase [Pseudomonas luteola]